MKFNVDVIPDPRKHQTLANRGGFNVDEEDDEAIIIEAAPVSNELEDDEKAEAQMALIVISTMFALVLCG